MEKASERTQRTLFGVAVAAFVVLGSQVGAWAVLLVDIATAAGADTPRLGVALSLMSIFAIGGAIVTGRIIDRTGRQVVLLVGSAGTGACLVALSFVGDYASMIGVFMAYGLLSSAYDIVVNALGGDYERAYGRSILTVLHGVFSGAAGVGALVVGSLLTVGVSFRAVYAGVGVLLVVFGTAAGLLFRLAPQAGPSAAERQASAGRRSGLLRVLGLPGVGIAAALVTLAFFNEGAIEGYGSVYLKDIVGSGAFAVGVGIAVFHFANMVGRLFGSRVINAVGESVVVAGGGTVAAIGYALALTSDMTGFVLVGMLLAGFGGSPIVPIAYSIAARWSGDRGGRAASVVTMFGYGSFIVAPSIIGALAGVFGLQRALLCVLVSAGLTAMTALLVRRLQRTRSRASAAGAA